MIGKLLGKVIGEVVAAPVTIAAEALEAGRETVDQAGKAFDRAGRTIEGDDDKEDG